MAVARRSRSAGRVNGDRVTRNRERREGLARIMSSLRNSLGDSLRSHRDVHSRTTSVLGGGKLSRDRLGAVVSAVVPSSHGRGKTLRSIQSGSGRRNVVDHSGSDTASGRGVHGTARSVRLARNGGGQGDSLRNGSVRDTRSRNRTRGARTSGVARVGGDAGRYRSASRAIRRDAASRDVRRDARGRVQSGRRRGMVVTVSTISISTVCRVRHSRTQSDEDGREGHSRNTSRHCEVYA